MFKNIRKKVLKNNLLYSSFIEMQHVGKKKTYAVIPVLHYGTMIAC